MLTPYQFWKEGKYHQCITSGFVHNDAGHLLINMYVLWLFGTGVEEAFARIYENGTLMYLTLFLSGILVSSAIDIIFRRNDPHFSTLGASGGVSTLVFASITLFPMEKMGLIFFPVMIPGYIFGILYLLYCLYQDSRNADNVNHMAHLIGAVWGILFMLLTWSETIDNFTRQIYGA